MGRRGAEGAQQIGVPMSDQSTVERLRHLEPKTAAGRWVKETCLPEIDRRAKRYRKLQDNMELQHAVIRHCAGADGTSTTQGMVDFVKDWTWSADPRRAAEGLPAFLPMCIWPEQIRFIEWTMARLDNQESGLCEKYRGAGASYLFACIMVGLWLFRPGFMGAFSSRKLDLADKLGDPDSLLEKCRIVLRGLPPWLRPVGYRESIHARYCLLENPETGGIIKAEGGSDIGRGGRQMMRVLDEFAAMEFPDRVQSACVESQASLFYLSTPRGPENAFSVLRHSGDVPVIALTWRGDPRCDDEWYSTQIKKFGKRIVRQEIDLDYTVSDSMSAVQAEWIQSAVWRRTRPEIFRRGAIVAALDVADSGGAENSLCIRQCQTIVHLEGWTASNLNETAHRAAEVCERFGAEVLVYDKVGIGAGIGAMLTTLEKPYNFEVRGLNWGEPAFGEPLPDAPEEMPEDRFINLRAQLWWAMRVRFEHTFLSAVGAEVYPEEATLEIPNDAELISQLPMLHWQRVSSGKLKLESKDSARRRGIKRLDRADSLAMSLVCDDGFGGGGILA